MLSIQIKCLEENRIGLINKIYVPEDQSTKLQELHNLTAPEPQKKRVWWNWVEKSFALLEFVQLQSDRSISNLVMSHWSVKGIAARANYFQQVDH